MSEIATISKERDDLGLHVDLCAQRYMMLEKRLEILEMKFDILGQEISQANTSLKTTMIGSTGTLLAGLMGLIVTLLMK
jgi:hypothetical protein